MVIRLLWARVGAIILLALIAAASGCGKKAAPEPSPRDAATEGEKSEAAKPPEKKAVVYLTDLRPLDAEASAGWDVPADPAPPFKAPPDLRVNIPLDGEPVVPQVPSPFVAVKAPKAKRQGTYRVSDLRSMETVGEPVVLPARSQPALSPDGKHLAALVLTGEEAGVVEAWSVQTGQSTFRHDMKNELGKAPDQIGLLSDGRLWAQVGASGQIWDMTERKKLVDLPARSWVRRWAAFSPNGRYLLSGRLRQLKSPFAVDLALWDLRTGKVVGERAFHPPGDIKGTPVAVAFSPDGQELALALQLPAGLEEGTWGRLACWDVKSGKKLHDHPLARSDVHPDANGLAVAETRIVQFWPGRRGWMLFGYLLIDRESGTVIRVKELSLPRDEADMQDRRFLDANHVTERRSRVPRAFRVITLPNAEIEEAVKEARKRQGR